MDIVEFNDRPGAPHLAQKMLGRYMSPLDGGYRDLQMTVKIQGMVCELQLNTKGMVHVKEGRAVATVTWVGPGIGSAGGELRPPEL